MEVLGTQFVRSTLVGLWLAVVVAGGARADDAKPTRLTTDLGYVKTGGNTEVTTVTGADKFEHRSGAWLFTQEAGVVWGESQGTETAGRYSASVRADCRLTGRMSAYGLGSWKRNTFAGISRQFDEGVGLVWNAVGSKPHTLDLEGGAGLLQRRTTLGVEEDFATGRAGMLYAYDFSEKARFEARGAYLVNLEDSEDGEGEARASLTAPVSTNLSLKLGYDLLYRNRPQPGFKELDTTFSVGVQATF